MPQYRRVDRSQRDPGIAAEVSHMPGRLSGNRNRIRRFDFDGGLSPHVARHNVRRVVVVSGSQKA